MPTTPNVWTDKGFWPFQLETLTPIFIGSGDKLSPLTYVLGTGEDTALYGIDLDRWLERHGAEQDILRVIESGDLPRVRKLLQEKVDPAQCAISRSATSRELRDKLLRQLGDSTSNATNEVDAALRSPLTGAPYIPGSSLKGALSTPLIDWLDDEAANRGKPRLKEVCANREPREAVRQYRGWMDEQFGQISEHAMQGLKVSDCPAGRDVTRVFQAVEKSRTAGKAGTPKAPCEALAPGLTLWGRLLLAEQNGTPALRLPNGALVSFLRLHSLCNTFYRKRYEDEKTRFYQLPHLRATLDALARVDERLRLLDEPNPPLLLRVGHYSHVESVTVTHNAPARRKGRNGQLMPSGTTRTLADGCLPFGWVLLHPCSPDCYARAASQSENAAHAEWEAEVLAELREGKRQQAQAEALRAAEIARQAALEAEARQKAEAAERLNSLPEEERLLLQLQTGTATEALSMDIYARLEQRAEPLRLDMARALREFWQKTGKWDGRQSKKQEAKIARLKSWLE